MTTLTVRELREAIAGLDDNAPVILYGVEGPALKAENVTEDYGLRRRVLRISGKANMYMDDLDE